MNMGAATFDSHSQAGIFVPTSPRASRSGGSIGSTCIIWASCGVVCSERRKKVPRSDRRVCLDRAVDSGARGIETCCVKNTIQGLILGAKLAKLVFNEAVKICQLDRTRSGKKEHYEADVRDCVE